MNPAHRYRDQRGHNSREYSEDVPYKKYQTSSRSASPRPYFADRSKNVYEGRADKGKYESWKEKGPWVNNYEKSRNSESYQDRRYSQKDCNYKKDSREYQKDSEYSEKNPKSQIRNYEKPKCVWDTSKKYQVKPLNTAILPTPKKIRCEFPEQILYEYRFLSSPRRSSQSDSIGKLLNSKSSKEELDEVLATIATDN